MQDLYELQQATSLKQVLQNMTKESMAVVQGRVISVHPLEIQVVGDDKLTLSQHSVCVPKHLTTHQATVELSGGSISVSMSGEGAHLHTDGQHEEHVDGDGMHEHTGGQHEHTLSALSISGATMTLYNGLSIGDIVYMLSFHEGKRYYILDREE